MIIKYNNYLFAYYNLFFCTFYLFLIMIKQEYMKYVLFQKIMSTPVSSNLSNRLTNNDSSKENYIFFKQIKGKLSGNNPIDCKADKGNTLES